MTPRSEGATVCVAVYDWALVLLQATRNRLVGLKVLHQRRAQAQERLSAGGRRIENDLVFAGPTGGPIPPGSVTRRFEALLARASVGRLRFHDLRHAAATVMLAQGVELRVISETLGHSSLGMMADVHAGVVPARGRAAAARMDEALGSPR